MPISNNAVAAVDGPGGAWVITATGLDSTRMWSGVTDAAFAWIEGTPEWTELAPVPGPGRLAATAQGFRGRFYLFGGYTVAEDGSESSLPDVAVFDPVTRSWSGAAPIPVPVDDAVSGVWADSLIVLVSGWHDRNNVPLVQLYDPEGDAWSEGTPVPGPAVFGHAGSVAPGGIVYLDGVAVHEPSPRFRMESSSWLGQPSSTDPERIEWSPLPPHPGPALYRAAAGRVDDWIVVAGGTDNPYNYDGIGYDGAPSQPRAAVFGIRPGGAWIELAALALPVPSMDHRSIAVTEDALVLVGGMQAAQTVVRDVWILARNELTRATESASPSN